MSRARSKHPTVQSIAALVDKFGFSEASLPYGSDAIAFCIRSSLSRESLWAIDDDGKAYSGLHFGAAPLPWTG